MPEEIAALCAVLGATALIQISPLRINPWTFVGNMLRKLWRAFCRSLNAEVLAEIGELKKAQEKTKEDLDKHIEHADHNLADQWRETILRFSDELRIGTPHSEEMFNEALEAIDKYETYCKSHDDYPNSKAGVAIQRIRDSYAERLKNDDFL